jgi:hypothetical protein
MRCIEDSEKESFTLPEYPFDSATQHGEIYPCHGGRRGR